MSFQSGQTYRRGIGGEFGGNGCVHISKLSLNILPENGTNTIGLDIEVKGHGLYNTLNPGGGGGYGGNGGSSGAGGCGGYGAQGGDGICGGGGGYGSGFGSEGEAASRHIAGGGGSYGRGGGYNPNIGNSYPPQYGGGGHSSSAGADGICIIQYYKPI